MHVLACTAVARTCRERIFADIKNCQQLQCSTSSGICIFILLRQARISSHQVPLTHCCSQVTLKYTKVPRNELQVLHICKHFFQRYQLSNQSTYYVLTGSHVSVKIARARVREMFRSADINSGKYPLDVGRARCQCVGVAACSGDTHVSPHTHRVRSGEGGTNTCGTF